MASSEHHPPTVLNLIVSILSLCTVASAVEFAGGTGTADDPYQIATAEQLVAIGSDPNLFDKHFVLVTDIDLAPDRPGGGVFDGAVIPLWRVYTPGYAWSGFAGSLDGAGHTIRNLTIAGQTAYRGVGLFTRIEPNGKVSNLLVRPVSIQCPNAYEVGVIAGENEGTILNCRANGCVSAHSAVGGLVGQNSGTIRGCNANCWVTGLASVGGLVGGHDAGLIEYCMAEGTVTGSTPPPRTSGGTVGGLVGVSGGTLSNWPAPGKLIQSS